jgi:hypothetical protein
MVQLFEEETKEERTREREERRGEQVNQEETRSRKLVKRRVEERRIAIRVQERGAENRRGEESGKRGFIGVPSSTTLTAQ